MNAMPAWVLCALLAVPAAASESSNLVDPTRPDGGGVYAPTGPVLESTMVSAGRKLAIIDGRVVGVGGRVGSATVTDIGPYQVILTHAGHETHLRLVPKIDKNANAAQGAHDRDR